MELLQDPRVTSDVVATSRMMTTYAQEPQHEGQVDEKAEEEEKEHENEDKNEEEEEEGGGRDEPSRKDECGGRDKGSQGQTSNEKSWMDHVRRLRDKIKQLDR